MSDMWKSAFSLDFLQVGDLGIIKPNLQLGKLRLNGKITYQSYIEKKGEELGVFVAMY